MKVKRPETDYKRAASYRGAFLLRQTRWGLIAQKWPRKRGKPKKASDVIKQSLFAYAAHWSTNPEPIAYQTAIYLTKGTLMMPRDMIIAAMYGNALTFIRPDGTIMKRYYDVAADPQATLDLITEETGAMLVRLKEGWVGLLPGNSGDVLTITNSIPDWAKPTAAGGGNGWTMHQLSIISDTTAHATKAMIVQFSQDATINELWIPFSLQAGFTAIIQIAKLTSNTITEIISGPYSFTPPSSRPGQLYQKLVSPIDITTADRIAVLLTQPSPPTTKGINCYRTSDAIWGAPLDLDNTAGGYIDSNSPAVGNTITLYSGYQPYLFLMAGDMKAN